MKATVTTYHANSSTARSIELALKPDNEAAPSPLRVRSRARGKWVVSTISGAQDIESLLATVDDVLLSLIAVDRLLSMTKWNRSKTSRRD